MVQAVLQFSCKLCLIKLSEYDILYVLWAIDQSKYFDKHLFVIDFSRKRMLNGMRSLNRQGNCKDVPNKVNNHKQKAI